jgi:hypothetical protein
LRMTWRMRQRHEGLPAPAFGDPDVILHHRVAAGKAMLRFKAFENPSRPRRAFSATRRAAASAAPSHPPPEWRQ